MPHKLFKNNTSQPLAECVRECALVKERDVNDGRSRVRFVKGSFMSERFCSTLSGFGKSRNKTKLSETEHCVSHEHRVYATHQFSAEQAMVSSSMLIIRQIDNDIR